MSSVVIKRLDSQIDDCYKCCLCGTAAYEYTGENDKKIRQRTKDPTHPDRELCWLSHDMDIVCHMVVDIGYRLDKQDPSREDFYGKDNSTIIEKI